MLVRLLASTVFCIFAFLSFREGDDKSLILFIALTVLFQPIIKIAFGRTIWNIVDLAVAGLLLFRVFYLRKKN